MAGELKLILKIPSVNSFRNCVYQKVYNQFMDTDESNQSCDRRLHIDGGVWDDGGLMALPSVPPSNLIVNIVCGRGRIRSSVLPDKFKDARVRTTAT
jgi:hypothetical protein